MCSGGLRSAPTTGYYLAALQAEAPAANRAGENISSFRSAISSDWLGRPEHAINVSANGLEFFPQHLISFNRVASDFLIDVGGHSGQICDVCLEAGLAITHRLD